MGEPVFRKKYTYTDYLEWPEGERVELIEGQPVYMSPAPSRKHQVVSRELIRKFGNYLDGNRCEVFDAPFDVRLFAEARENDEVENVVQPDLVVFCDPEKLDDKGGKGTPDLVIEILSTSTAKIDKLTKKSLYEKAGVKEYWVVDPVHELLEVYLLKDDGKYGEYQLYSKEDTVPVNIFPDLTIDLDKIFLP